MNSLEYSNIAILIPCYNEADTVSQVVTDFRNVFPKASVYVYDNCSTDETQKIAKDAGAIVKSEKNKGKGNVVRRMFADIEADFYILVDGDHTYDSKVAQKMLNQLIQEDIDMLNIARIGNDKSYRAGHRFGNFILTKAVQLIFGRGFNDMLSGYRIFSRRFVKTFPARSNGFEIETELAVHSLEMKIPFGESYADYIERPSGSQSKLSTYRDGFKILLMINKLFFLVRPIASFSLISSLFALGSIIIGWIQVLNPLLNDGVITKYPSVILSSSLMILSIFFFMTGLVINSISNMRKDQFRLNYLNSKK